MPATYDLDAKIQALNLLDRHDGDFKLVKSRLGISVNALRGWLADEKQLRMQYDYRQWRYFGNLKLVLLNQVLEGAVSTMEKYKAGDYEHSSPSQQAYIVATLVSLSRHLETSFETMEPMSQSATEQPNKMRFISEEAPPLPAAPNPPQPAPTQSAEQPAAPEKEPETGTDQDPDGNALATAAPPPSNGPEPPDGTELSDAWLNHVRSGRQSQKPKKRPKLKPRQPARNHRKRRKKRR